MIRYGRWQCLIRNVWYQSLVAAPSSPTPSRRSRSLAQWSVWAAQWSKSTPSPASLSAATVSRAMRTARPWGTPAPPPSGGAWCTTCRSAPPPPPPSPSRRSSPATWWSPGPSTPWWRRPCTVRTMTWPGLGGSHQLTAFAQVSREQDPELLKL